MRAPDITYRFSLPIATSGPTLELFAKRTAFSNTNANIVANITGPAKDRIFVLTNLNLELIPGATQSVVRGRVDGRTPGGLVFSIANIHFAGTADERQEINWQGEIYIGGAGMDIEILLGAAQFSAGVASNTIEISAAGFVIPRGNVAPY